MSVVPAQGTTTNLRGYSHASGHQIQRHQCVNECPLPQSVFSMQRIGNHKLYCGFFLSEKSHALLTTCKSKLIFLISCSFNYSFDSYRLLTFLQVDDCFLKTYICGLSYIFWMHWYLAVRAKKPPLLAVSLKWYIVLPLSMWDALNKTKGEAETTEAFAAFSRFGLVSQKGPAFKKWSPCPS